MEAAVSKRAAAGKIILETYPLIPPYAYAHITKDPESKEIVYTVVEVPLRSEEKKYLNLIKEILIAELDIDFRTYRGDPKKAEDYIKTKVLNIVHEYKLKIDDKTLDRLNYHIRRDFVGYGPIDPLMHDPNIEEISCDGVGIPIYVWHRRYESIRTNIKFDNEEDLDAFVIKLAQRAERHISVANPLLDAALDDGSRIQLTLGRDVTQKGSTFTIRRFRTDPLTISDLIQYNTLDENMAAYFWYILENRASILIGGGTAAGKTSLLNALAMFIRPGLKIVSIEDTAELNIPHENWIPSVARQGYGEKEADGRRRGEITLDDLLRAALRQRPDYLFVGEVRGAEAYIMFQAMATGHSAMATIHGDSTRGIIRRLESPPMNIHRQMIEILDCVAVIRKMRRGDKTVRRVVEVVEIVGNDPVTNDLITNDLFIWNGREDTFTFYGNSHVLSQIAEAHGLTDADVMDELERRKIVLRWMVKKKITHFSQVAEIIQRYYQAPEQLYEQAKSELRAV